MNVRNEFSMDRQIAKIISEYIIIRILYNAVRRILSMRSTMATMFLALMLIVWILVNINTMLNALRYREAILIFAEIGFMIIYTFSFLLGNVSIGTLLRYIAYSCALCSPFLALTSNVDNMDIFYDEMLKWSYTITLVGMLVVFSRHSNNDYNMSYSYLMLFPLIIITNETIKQAKIKNIIFLIINLGLIITYGSRGPLLCWVLFILFRIFLTNELNANKIIWLGAFSILVLNYDKIGSIIISFCSEHGILNEKSLNPPSEMG